MDDAARRDLGAKRRREILGEQHVADASRRTTPLTADFQDLITRYAWGEVWARPGLDVRSRRILVLGTLVALGRWEEFRMHAQAALGEGGFTLDDLKEIALQQAIYCGVPAAHHAFQVLSELEQGG